MALAAWWTGGLVLTLFKLRSWLSWVGSVAYAAVAAFLMVLTYSNEHSTAGIGLMYWPVALYVVAGLCVGIEGAIADFRE